MRHEIPTPVRAFLAILAVAVGIAARGAGAADGPWDVRLRDALRRYFPEAYSRSLESYGWRVYRFGEWRAPDLETPYPERAVVLVHGLDEPGRLWITAAPALDAEGYALWEFRYPNDQPVRASASFFADSLAELPAAGVREVVIVAHSMGGLVSRELLTSPAIGYAERNRSAAMPTVRRLICVGTPNGGSPLAKYRGFAEIREQWTRFLLADGHLLGGLTDGSGQAGDDLLPGSEFLRELNARPHAEGVELTLIAGVASPLSGERVDATVAEWKGVLPPAAAEQVDRLGTELHGLSEGIGDGAVSVSSARLAGVADFVTVPGNHLSMIRNVLGSSERVPPALPVILERLRGTWPKAN